MSEKEPDDTRRVRAANEATRDVRQTESERVADLRTSQRDFLAQYANDVVILADDEAHILEANDRASLVYGYTREELLQMSLADLYPLAARDCAREELELVRQEGSRVFESTHIRADGIQCYMEVSARAIQSGGRTLYLALERDVTERKVAERALRESEARYRALAESSPLGIFVTRNDEVILANPACAELFGASSPDELIGRSTLELFHPDYREAVRERIREDSETVPLVEVKILRLDGSPVDVEAAASVLVDQGVNAIQVVLRDITERRKMVDELLARTEDLARSNAELEKFAYIASHDLQEPLRMVASYVQLLQRRYQGKLDSDADEFIGYAVDGANRMQTLINDLLTYSRVGTQGDPFSPSDLEVVFRDVLRSLERLIDESGARVTHDPLPTVTCDPTQIGQVFQNLIVNAIKFHDGQPPAIHVSADEEPGRWVFSVQDNGMGIEPQYFERIFVIFQRLQARADYPGTGMGLAICRRIVERHGGRIWVESTLGAGSTFYFTLHDSKEE